MTAADMAAALQRVEALLQRRPEAGLHEDAPATAHWHGGTRVVTRHANGTRVETDMPGELGGCGAGVTPGWLVRAGLAACAVTRIAMSAASQGIELSVLEVRAGSRSDLRGLLGMPDASGAPVSAGPLEVQLLVRIAAPGVEAARLRALVEDSQRCSPVSCALQAAVPISVRIEVDGG
ncbi:OsmC-like protein [compost metagenome]